MPTVSVGGSISNTYDMIEAIKILRTNIFFSGDNVRTIALTSCHENEGKSTIALELAVSIAQAGKRVLFLDADLRKSVLNRRLRVVDQKGTRVEGLSHYLSGMTALNDVICGSDVPGLYVIFAGMLVSNADELLGSERFSALMKALRKTFDYIIVDSAPLGQVIDCAVMAPSVDRVALVVDVEANSYKVARRVLKQLDNVDCKVLGVILNNVSYKERGGYYGSYGKYYGAYGSNN